MVSAGALQMNLLLPYFEAVVPRKNLGDCADTYTLLLIYQYLLIRST